MEFNLHLEKLMRKIKLSPTRNIHSHFRRYKWLVTISGGLLVFGTFIIKDWKREELKTLIDSLAAAESAFLIRRDIASIKNPVSRDFSTDYSTTSLEAASSGLDEWLTQTEGALDNISNLIDAIPEAATEEQRQMLHELKKRDDSLSKILEGLDHRIAALPMPDAPQTPDPDHKAIVEAPDPEAMQISQLLNSTIELNLHLSIDAARLSDSVIKRAREVEKAKRKSYERFTVVSVFLYSIGWFIGLLGQFLGLEPSEGK